MIYLVSRANDWANIESKATWQLLLQTSLVVDESLITTAPKQIGDGKT